MPKPCRSHQEAHRQIHFQACRHCTSCGSILVLSNHQVSRGKRTTLFHQQQGYQHVRTHHVLHDVCFILVIWYHYTSRGLLHCQHFLCSNCSSNSFLTLYPLQQGNRATHMSEGYRQGGSTTQQQAQKIATQTHSMCECITRAAPSPASCCSHDLCLVWLGQVALRSWWLPWLGQARSWA